MTNIISKQYLNTTETRKAIDWEKICEDIKEKLGKDFLINSTESLIIDKVVRPKKSNLIKPAFSTYFIENCVALIEVSGSL